MPSSVGAKVLAEVYRLHHIPLPPITLQALLKRGPRFAPGVVERLQNNPAELQKVCGLLSLHASEHVVFVV
jgi:hypothetical protein